MRCRFSQKANKQICFVFLPWRVASFFERIYVAPICLRFYLTFNPRYSNSPTLAYPWPTLGPPLAHQITQPLGCMLPWEAEQPVNCNKANVCCKYIMQLRTTSAQWDEITSAVAFLSQSKFCKSMYCLSLESTTMKIKSKGQKGWLKKFWKSISFWWSSNDPKIIQKSPT